MKRNGKGLPKEKMLKAAAAALAVVAFVVCFPWIGPLLEDLLGRAAVLSTAFTLPDGAAITLQEKYAPDIYAPDGTYPDPGLPQNPTGPDDGESGKPPTGNQTPGQQYPIPEDIPEEYRGMLVEVCMTGEDTSSFYNHQGGWIRNYTQQTAAQLEAVLATGYKGGIVPSGQPQILIYHTHATESYEPYDSFYYDMRNTWRTTDNNNNVVAVGAALKEALEAQGFVVIHDTGQYDYPSYNGSYDRSRAAVERYLEEYPTLTVLLDVHRDAILYDDDSVAKPVAEIDGKKAAQVMIAACCDDGTGNLPGWKNNFRLAAALEAEAQRQAPDLMRPVFFAYRHYNQDLTPNTLLLEMGSNGNTLEEAIYAAELLGPILADVLQNGG